MLLPLKPSRRNTERAPEDGGALSALEREGQRRAVGNQRPHTVDGAAPIAGRIIHASCWPPSRAIP